MANVLYPPERPLAVGEILDLTFGIYRRTLVKCLVLAGLGVLAGQLPNLYNLARGRGLTQSAQSLLDPSYWLFYLLGMLVVVSLGGAILLRQYAIITGHDTGGELRAGLQRVPSWMLLFLLTCIAFAGACVPGGLLMLASPWLGAPLIVITLSYLMIAFSVTAPLLIVRRMSALTSLERSWQLTRGSFWRLSMIYSVALVMLIVLYVIAAAIGGVLAGVLGHGDVAVTAATLALVVVALGAFATPFYTALGLAVLGDLTVRREGADLEQRISATV